MLTFTPSKHRTLTLPRRTGRDSFIVAVTSDGLLHIDYPHGRERLTLRFGERALCRKKVEGWCVHKLHWRPKGIRRLRTHLRTGK